MSLSGPSGFAPLAVHSLHGEPGQSSENSADFSGVLPAGDYVFSVQLRSTTTAQHYQNGGEPPFTSDGAAFFEDLKFTVSAPSPEVTIRLVSSSRPGAALQSAEMAPGSDGQTVNRTAEIGFKSVVGDVYSLEWKNSLSDPAWSRSAETSNIQGTGQWIYLQDASGGLPTRFYRVVLDG